MKKKRGTYLRLTGREALAFERCLSNFATFRRGEMSKDFLAANSEVRRLVKKQMMESGIYRFQPKSLDEPIKVLAGTLEIRLRPAQFRLGLQVVNYYVFTGIDKRKQTMSLVSKLQSLCNRI